MKIIAFIEARQGEVLRKKLLQHLLPPREPLLQGQVGEGEVIGGDDLVGVDEAVLGRQDSPLVAVFLDIRGPS